MNPSEQNYEIACPHCAKKLKIPDRLFGKVVKCAGCSKQFRIGKPAQPAPQQAVLAPHQSTAAPHQSIGAPKLTVANQSFPNLANEYPSGSQYPNASRAVPQSLPKRQAALVSNKFVWIVGAGVTLVLGTAIAAFWIQSGADPNDVADTSWKAYSGPVTATEPSKTAAAVGRVSNTQLPILTPSKKVFTRDIDYHEVDLEWDVGKPMKLYIYVPKGTHKNGTLPCVFEAPAGTNMLHGAGIGSAEESATYLPFLKEGMVTVSYSIDGHLPFGVTPNDGARYMQALAGAYKSFVASDAGVKNGQAAIDYVLGRFPLVDREKIYTWGHSSAATLALLLAAKDPRVKRCIAMAPVTSLKSRLGELVAEPRLKKLFPGIDDYLRTGSPDTYLKSLKCKVFLAHAKDDDNVPFAESQGFVKDHKGQGGDILFLEMPRGGHYTEMLELGMPEAIKWLKQ
jgi:fermentation-respiration switch protein FrsA (DUF1100 family)